MLKFQSDMSTTYFNYNPLKLLVDVHGHHAEDKKCLDEYFESFASYC